MSRIAANLSGMERNLMNRMAEANAQVATSALRLATMKKINHPSDDPAAFVQLAGLQNSLGAVNAAMANVTRASSMVTQSQTAMTQIVAQLGVIRTELLKDEGHTLTADQRAESQAKIDTAIDQINALAGTSIDGRKMLDGSADFLVSGRNANQIAKASVYATGGVERVISGQVLTAGARASLGYTGAAGKATAGATFTLSGTRGNTTITVANLEDLTDVADDVNQNSHDTGVTASVVGDTLTMTSVGYGTDAKAQVQVTSGTFVISGGDADGADYGASGTAVINGHSVTASAADGNTFVVSDSGARFEIQAKAGFTGTFNTMTVAADAVSFDLTGQAQGRATLALPSVRASSLGGYSGTLDQLQSGGTCSGLGDNTARAIRIVDEALGQTTRVQGRLDGFYAAAVQSSSALLSGMETNLGDAIDSIDLVDEDEETTRLEFYQGLASNASASLAILSQQRGEIVALIKHIAGLV